MLAHARPAVHRRQRRQPAQPPARLRQSARLAGGPARSHLAGPMARRRRRSGRPGVETSAHAVAGRPPAGPQIRPCGSVLRHDPPPRRTGGPPDLPLAAAAAALPAACTTGEIVPKLDQERLLLVSPELGEVLTAIIQRVRRGEQAMPLVSAYDTLERLWSAPMPFVFQRRCGLEDRAIPRNYIYTCLNDALAASGLTGPNSEPLRYTPHDFRRIFVTDALRPRAHRRPHLRPPDRRHHSRIRRDLPRGGHQPPPALHRPPPIAATQQRVPRAHRARVAGLPGPLRAAEGHVGRLRPRLRHPVRPRVRLHPLPRPATRPRGDAPAGGDPRQPARPAPGGQGTGLARRGRGDRGQPRRRRAETRCHARPRSPAHHRPPRHA